MKNSNHKVSDNVCSVYDYSKRRWNIQPSDIVRFWDRDSSSVCVGEVVWLTSELVQVRRLKDDRIFVISLYVISDWQLRPVDYVRRLPSGIFSVGERVLLAGDLNLPDQRYVIVRFDGSRVKICLSVNGRTVGFYFVREEEVIKF